MIFSHEGFSPIMDDSATVTPTAVVCGQVRIGKNTRIMYGATVIAEGGEIVIGDNCVILENAVLRSTVRHSLHIGNECLIGPHAHVVGCTVEDHVFIATGATVFHGARLCEGSEVRINGVVHLKSTLPRNATVPINWVALGDPAMIFPPDQHDEIEAVQRPLNFPLFAYGVDRKASGESNMLEISHMMTDMLKRHEDDCLME